MFTIPLQIPDGSEQITLHNLNALFATMAFPLPEQKKLRDNYKLIMWLKCIEYGEKTGSFKLAKNLPGDLALKMLDMHSYSELAKLASKDMLAKFIAGFMFLSVSDVIDDGNSEAGTRRAAYHVREVFKEGTFILNTNNSPNEKNIFSYWSKYKCVAPWFACLIGFGGAEWHNDNPNALFGFHNFFDSDSFYFDATVQLEPFVSCAMDGLQWAEKNASRLNINHNTTWHVPEEYPLLDIARLVADVQSSEHSTPAFQQFVEDGKRRASEKARSALEDSERYLEVERVKRKSGDYD